MLMVRFGNEAADFTLDIRQRCQCTQMSAPGVQLSMANVWFATVIQHKRNLRAQAYQLNNSRQLLMPNTEIARETIFRQRPHSLEKGWLETKIERLILQVAANTFDAWVQGLQCSQMSLHCYALLKWSSSNNGLKTWLLPGQVDNPTGLADSLGWFNGNFYIDQRYNGNISRILLIVPQSIGFPERGKRSKPGHSELRWVPEMDMAIDNGKI
jgi:hypothetical protein